MNGRETLGVVDTVGPLQAVVALVCSTSDDLGSAAEVLSRIAPGHFEVLPRRRVVEPTRSWFVKLCRFQVDPAGDPEV